MRALSASDLLDVWERGRPHGAVQRALAVLGAACPNVPPEALAELTIGQRDGRLLTLREWAFGSRMTGLSICPCCRDRLELVFETTDIRSAPEHTPAEPGAELSLSAEGYEIRFRVPNSLDLQATSGTGDATETRQRLLERCISTVQVANPEGAQPDGEAGSIDDLPTTVIDEVAAHMAKADPQADVQLTVSCPACGHEWLAMLDVVSFFWAEIETWAYRTLNQVHSLASAYGWREADILAMSAWRRQRYLEMIGTIG